jgi:hypothetical protein
MNTTPVVFTKFYGVWVQLYHCMDGNLANEPHEFMIVTTNPHEWEVAVYDMMVAASKGNGQPDWRLYGIVQKFELPTDVANRLLRKPFVTWYDMYPATKKASSRSKNRGRRPDLGSYYPDPNTPKPWWYDRLSLCKGFDYSGMVS